MNPWNPNDPCFDWKRPCFGGVKAKNRGQTGSRSLYCHSLWFTQIYPSPKQDVPLPVVAVFTAISRNASGIFTRPFLDGACFCSTSDFMKQASIMGPMLFLLVYSAKEPSKDPMHPIIVSRIDTKNGDISSRSHLFQTIIFGIYPSVSFFLGGYILGCPPSQ